jgi:hypothetical protein
MTEANGSSSSARGRSRCGLNDGVDTLLKVCYRSVRLVKLWQIGVEGDAYFGLHAGL